MSTVGYANVVVVPTFDGFQKAVGRQVNSTMPAAGATAGSLMAGGMASGLASGSGGILASARNAASSASGGFVTRAAAGIRGGASAMAASMRTSLAGSFAAGQTAGASMGTGFVGGAMRALGPLAAIFGGAAVLGSGFSRFASIEDAEATLLGLGHTAETVDEVMANVDSAVHGTALRTDQAATVASGLLASGIEPGEELTRTLRGVGDAATIANVSMGDMGAIYNKIAASGRIQGEEINQLSDQGIPVLQLLSEHLGVTTQEVRDMASAGEIGFADFTAAMEGGMEGAAEQSGNTLRGLFSNVGAYVAQLGAAIVEELAPTLRSLGEGIIEVIDEDIIPAFERAVAWFDDNKDWVLPLVQGLIGGLGLVFAIQMTSRALGFLRGAMTLVMSHPILLAIGLLTAGFIYLWQTNEGFRSAMIAAWDAISGAVSYAWETWIRPALSAAWDWIQNKLVPAVLWFWHEVMVPAWNAISAAVQWAWVNVIQPAFNWIWGFINDSLIPAVMWLWHNVMVPAWNAISFVIDQAWSAINIIFDAIVWAIEEHIAPKVMWLWENVFSPAFEGIGNAISWAWENVIRPIWERMSTFIEDTVAPGIQRGVEIAGNAFNAIANLFRLPINFVLDYVWNKGIVRVFNAVAGAIDSDHRLDEASMIQPFGGSTSSSRGRAGRGNAPLARAKGGYTPPGWTWVGEEGPELVNFADPSMIYTAAQSEALSRAIRGEDLDDRQSRAAAGSTPRQALLPMGPTDEERALGIVDGLGRGGVAAAGEAVQWVRGGLAAAAEAILNPVKSGINSTVGQWGAFGRLGGDAASNAIDNLVDWIRGEDEEYLARQLTTMGGSDAFDVGKATSGGWVRPGPGPVTSRFGPRWGGSHSGIDLAMPVGTPLRAPRSGRVIRAGWNTLAGRSGIGMMMQHNGWGSYFGHLSQALLGAGDTFRAGQIVARSGNTGRSTGPHLHFEVNRGNFQAPINPSATGLFDEGGVLSHGQMALNLSGKPEAVLTNDQWASLESFANTGLPEEITLVLADGEAFPAYIRRESHVEHQSIRKHEGAWR